jgi:hypothetical protein
MHNELKKTKEQKRMDKGQEKRKEGRRRMKELKNERKA